MIEVRKRTIPHYPKSYLRALFLCAFLGIFGIHRFYTGYKRIGFIQLFTLGGFGIWWMVDLISMCFNSYKDKYGIEMEEYNGTVASLVLTAVAVGLITVSIMSLPTIYEHLYLAE